MIGQHKLTSKDVINIFDASIGNPKDKWEICVCPETRLFLRINSQPVWKPHHPILKAENPFLKRDSFVEFRAPAYFSWAEIEGALRDPANRLGRLTDAVANQIAHAALQASTLTDEQKDLIFQNLANW